MRGSDQQTGSLFGDVNLEERIPPRPSAAQDQVRRGFSTGQPRRGFRAALRGRGAPVDRSVDRARAVVTREPRADPVLDPLRTLADGAAAVQSLVGLDHRALNRNRKAGSD